MSERFRENDACVFQDAEEVSGSNQFAEALDNPK
jgi:hypothetical protein